MDSEGGGADTLLVMYSDVRIFSEIQGALDCKDEGEFGIPRNLYNFQPRGDSTEIKDKVEGQGLRTNEAADGSSSLYFVLWR